MPETPCHIINHTAFAVTMGREVDAFKAQAQLEDFFHQRLTPALDQALSDFASDADCQIERLVIFVAVPQKALAVVAVQS